MHALFIGQAYIDITFLADLLPTDDEKTVARDYAVSFGGNVGRMFIDIAAKYGISLHHR
jgi:sulfofructose kinase